MSPEPTPTPNPNGGPNTPEGRAISSLNATTFGLYASRDFVRPNEESNYRDLGEQLRRDLAPIGLLEDNLVDEIRRAMWRLGRCGEVEQSFVTDYADPASIPDPMRHEIQAKLQLSVDRARALYQRLLHKCTAELRKLQTERRAAQRTPSRPAPTSPNSASATGLSSAKILTRPNHERLPMQKATQGMAEIDAILSTPIRPPAQPGSFCKTPRNAPCPCGSGQKHKRCCGKETLRQS